MSTATAEATKTQTSAGSFLTIIGLLVLIIPWLYFLYAQVTGSVSLATADDISNVVYGGIVVTGAALGIGVIASLLNLLEPRRGTVSIILSLLTVVVAAVLLFALVLPRATSVQNLNNNVIPFAQSINADCGTPLNHTTDTFKMALADAQNNATNNTGFATAMSVDAMVLQTNDGELSNGVYALRTISAPDTKYKPLLQDCIQTEQTELNFLVDPNSPSAIQLPAPFNSQIPSVSAIGLLQTSAQVASGQSPFGTLPPGTIQQLVIAALTQIVNSTNPQLTAEGQALTQDIKNGLDTNLSPFKVTVPIQ